MGRPKLLLPWGNTTILGHHFRTWHACGAGQIAAVFDPANTAVTLELERLEVTNRIPNADAHRGMFSSVQCAAGWPGWSKEVTHLAFVLGDQPHLAPALLAELLDFQKTHPEFICQPEYKGAICHPVLVPKALLAGLSTSPGPTLREFLEARADRRRTLQTDTVGIEMTTDIDHPRDYETLRVWSRNPHER